MNKGQEFEEKFIETVSMILRQSSMTAKDFAKIAFPGQAKPDNKWQRICVNTKNGKCQNVTLEDAYAMAAAIGQDLSSLVWKIEKEIGIDPVYNTAPLKKKSSVDALKGDRRSVAGG